MDEDSVGRAALVVGFDESAAARSAPAWAAAEATRAGVARRAIHVMSWPFGPWADGDGMTHEELDEGYRAAVTAAYEACAPPRGTVLGIARGDAGPVLVERSRRAAALVLGRPGFVGASRLLMGSVAHHGHHATCPVVTLPPRRTASPHARPTPSLQHEVSA